MTETTRVSNTRKAGLSFPVGRARRCLRETAGAYRVGVGAPVALAAVIEYLTAELMERPCALTREAKKQRVTPKFILAGIAEDAEMAEFLKRTLVVMRPHKKTHKRRAAAAAAK